MNSLQRVWNCSYISINTKVHLYQALIRSLFCSNLKGTETYMNTLEAFHMRCQRRCMLVGSCLQCRGASATWFINHWWHLTSSTLISVWPCACLDPGVTAHDALSLMVDTYEGRKPMASWRRPPKRLATSGFNKVQADANALLLSTLWRSEITGGHAAAQRFTRTTRWWWWWWWRM